MSRWRNTILWPAENKSTRYPTEVEREHRRRRKACEVLEEAEELGGELVEVWEDE